MIILATKQVRKCAAQTRGLRRQIPNRRSGDAHGEAEEVEGRVGNGEKLKIEKMLIIREATMMQQQVWNGGVRLGDRVTSDDRR